ncbi:hypothetical protein E1B28_010157 [Marasmius oreades]|uniref:Uncharacterized protein n=1 Tax=Marasmius oreades TaxID=181124 RepID=A0A9P7RX85_9AGAR|nr:uncharacterized protein E1B28_010157 [Marasmius oreades]KAG7091102.1 hypothetical protein E1B28_010157 [Marasmius oreades]
MPSTSRADRYRQALSTISARTGASLPSLILSFGILHEVTAIAPLIGFFYGARVFGVGERVANAVMQEEPNAWARQRLRTWIEEGEGWAERVGRRYGLFGYQKKMCDEDTENATFRPYVPGHIAGDVANAVVAYGITKALLPVRIGLSLYLSPAFSRRVVEPIKRLVVRQFK